MQSFTVGVLFLHGMPLFAPDENSCKIWPNCCTWKGSLLDYKVEILQAAQAVWELCKIKSDLSCYCFELYCKCSQGFIVVSNEKGPIYRVAKQKILLRKFICGGKFDGEPSINLCKNHIILWLIIHFCWAESFYAWQISVLIISLKMTPDNALVPVFVILDMVALSSTFI